MPAVVWNVILKINSMLNHPGITAYSTFKSETELRVLTELFCWSISHCQSRQIPASMNAVTWILRSALDSENPHAIWVRRVWGGLQFNLLLRVGLVMTSAWAAHPFTRVCLETSKGRDYKTSKKPPRDYKSSVSILCLTVLTGREILLTPSLNFSCFNLGLACLILLPHSAAQMLAWSSVSSWTGLGWLMLLDISSPGWASPWPSPSPCSTSAPASTLSGQAPVGQCLFRTGRVVQNWTQYSKYGLPSAESHGRTPSEQSSL